MIHDISPTLHPGTAVWPGDVTYSRQVAMGWEQGNHLELSSIQTTVHIGAHTDAPNHYVPTGQSIDQRDLSLYYGPCQVITVGVGRNQRVLPAMVNQAITTPRVLFRTSTFPDPDHFNEDFAALSPELIHWLADQNVRLVGLDTPSVDLCKDSELLAHHAIAERDLAILEGIVLDQVPDGVYTLIALPLKLAGADASPVRAALVEVSHG